VLQEMDQAWMASEADLYLNTSGSLASADHASSSWRTYQLSLFGDSTEFSWDSMRWGMMRDGQLYQPQKWVPRTSESGSGYLPTPVTVDTGSYFNKSASSGAALRPTLGAMARFNLWPTPLAGDSRGAGPNQHVKRQHGGQLNPNWVEWLMGWPIGSTVCESWAMEWFRSVQKKPSLVSEDS
jgi:hypothetical protein